jgi:hypothetical protein
VKEKRDKERKRLDTKHHVANGKEREEVPPDWSGSATTRSRRKTFLLVPLEKQKERRM